MTARPLYQIVLRADPHPIDPVIRVRTLLKRAARDHALHAMQCVEVSTHSTKGSAVKVSREFPGRFMKASDLDRPVTHTIRDITKEQLRGRNGLEDKLVLWFAGTKQGLPTNVTNQRLLVGTYGDETDEWLGKKIMLRVERVRGFDGDLVDSIVIDVDGLPHPKRRQQQPPWPAADAQAPLDDDPELADDPVT